MVKRFLFVLGVVCLLLGLPGAAKAQQQAAEPAVYTYVAEWAVPRAQWDDFVANWEKNSKPILEKMSANGTLVGWGAYSTVIHEPDGFTHGAWWAATSIAGLEKVRDELIKQPPNAPLIAATRHRDYLLRSIFHGTRATGPASGYLWVSSSMVQPGKGQDWRAYWEKYSKPVYDQLLKDGTITYYSLDVEQVHTEPSGLRFVVYITPNADGVDKVTAAFAAETQKRSEAERNALGVAFGDMVVAGAHRDYFARVSSYWTK